MRNMVDTHNIQWRCLEDVVNVFEIALVNRAYSPFADPGPNLRLGPGSEKGEYLARGNYRVGIIIGGFHSKKASI